MPKSTNQVPGLSQVGGGVNTKSAAYAVAKNISSLQKFPEDEGQWTEFVCNGISYGKYPKELRPAYIGQTTSTSIVGERRDEFMNSLTSDLSTSCKYGRFSGTLDLRFDLTESTTEGYSFGTYTYIRQLLTLQLPVDHTVYLDPDFLTDLQDSGIDPANIYDTYGTHYTDKILVGATGSLSLRSQYKQEYSDEKFGSDMSAAYDSIIAKFKTSGSFSYESSNSSEQYESSSSLNLVGGDSNSEDFDAWKATADTYPTFIDYADSNSLKPIYELLPSKSGKRYEQLKSALDDYLNPPLQVRTFAKSSTLTDHPNVNVTVPENYKVVSGGAFVTYDDSGEMLTASYPVDTNQWAARAKDCNYSDQGILTAHAVAVYDPYDQLIVKVFRKSSTDPEDCPSCSAKIDSGYALTGGGAETHYQGVGSYLTASCPSIPPGLNGDRENMTQNADTWIAKSKDHLQACLATITAYAIGVKWSDEGSATPIESTCTYMTSAPESHPRASIGKPSGTVLVGGGALDDWQGAGNMLVASYPSDENTWTTEGKDHHAASTAPITAYAIGVKNMEDSEEGN